MGIIFSRPALAATAFEKPLDAGKKDDQQMVPAKTSMPLKALTPLTSRHPLPGVRYVLPHEMKAAAQSRHTHQKEATKKQLTK